MVWSSRKNAKPENVKTNCNSYIGKKKEKMKTTYKMEGLGSTGLKDIGNKRQVGNG
jgi:hypothetical protein